MAQVPAGGRSEEEPAGFQGGVALMRDGQAKAGIAEPRRVVARTPANEDAWFWLAKKHGHPKEDQAVDGLRSS